MDFLCLVLFKWVGDVVKFDFEEGENKGQFYIELVIFLNNFDGKIQYVIVKEMQGGYVLYDLVYYWFYYMFIIVVVDYDIMFFIFFKSIGYVGICIG